MSLILADKAILILVILNLHFSDCVQIQWFSDDPDIDRNGTQLISSRGFIPESHTVITTDGYILTVFRIVNPYLKNSSTKLKPIYFQHGLFGNSDVFLLNENGFMGKDGIYVEDNNLVNNCTAIDPESVATTTTFVLAACGYDVWLGNNRGNKYSKRHVLLDSDKDTRYWHYTVDHYSAYDVTAIIGYIMKATNSESIAYIGHSLGTTMMFQLLSAQPEYSQVIKPYIALAPVAYVGNIEAIIMRVGALFEPVLGSFSIPFFGVPPTTLSVIDRFIAHFICGNSLFVEFCEIFLFSLCGFDFPNTNTTRIPAMFGHFPDDTSSLVLAHLAQRVDLKTFKYYDYGTVRNKKVYGQPKPPKYDLSKITSENMIFMSGVNDFLSDPTDVDILRSELTVRIYDDYVVPYTLWNHADFLIGINAGKLMNARILRLLKNF